MIEPPEPLVTLARASGPLGEVLLRRRAGVEELIVDGVFAMDSAQTSSERALGRLAAGAPQVLVGGLGLGYTVAAVLERADRSSAAVQVDVVELEPALVTWAQAGVTPTLGQVAADPRVRLHVGDVSMTLAGRRQGPYGPWDAIVLDVDNGPDFLIHPGNEALYGEAALAQAHRQLRPGGTLAVWCQAQAPGLLAAMTRVSPSARELLCPVQRGERRFSYAIYTLTRAVGGLEAPRRGGPE